jgi:hypothetical protein
MPSTILCTRSSYVVHTQHTHHLNGCRRHAFRCKVVNGGVYRKFATYTNDMEADTTNWLIDELLLNGASTFEFGDALLSSPSADDRCAGTPFSYETTSCGGSPFEDLHTMVSFDTMSSGVSFAQPTSMVSAVPIVPAARTVPAVHTAPTAHTTLCALAPAVAPSSSLLASDGGQSRQGGRSLQPSVHDKNATRLEQRRERNRLWAQRRRAEHKDSVNALRERLRDLSGEVSACQLMVAHLTRENNALREELRRRQCPP